MMTRVCKNYIRHTIYYGKSELLTRENDVWVWFVIGIFYHMGEGKEDGKQEQIIFWSVDIVMNRFGNLTRAAFYQHIRKII